MTMMVLMVKMGKWRWRSCDKIRLGSPACLSARNGLPLLTVSSAVVRGTTCYICETIWSTIKAALCFFRSDLEVDVGCRG